jgi:hypothetical protein
VWSGGEIWRVVERRVGSAGEYSTVRFTCAAVCAIQGCRLSSTVVDLNNRAFLPSPPYTWYALNCTIDGRPDLFKTTLRPL